MKYFKKNVKDPIFEELKISNPNITIGIINCGEKVCCSLRRRNKNTNKFYNVHLDNEINTTTEIPFLELLNIRSNMSIIQMGTVVLLDDDLGGKACDHLIGLWNLNSLYIILSSIITATQEGFTTESVQDIINNLVENKVNLSSAQLFVIRQMLNFEVVKKAPLEIVSELVEILNNIFDSNTSWDSDNRSTKRLFI